MIELKDVCVGYGGITVVNDVSTCFERGSVTFIIGPNGCGKSTLIRAMAGIVPVSGGEILLDGKDLTGYRNAERASLIAYLPQTRPVPEMKVASMVRHGRYPHMGFSKTLSKKDIKMVDTAVQMTELEPILHKRLDTVSGGERQRAYLAMAIAQDAEIMLLDEPGTYLDLVYQMELMDMVKKLHMGGKTIIMAAHDLPQAFTFAEKICLMQKGRVLMHDTPEKVAESGLMSKIFGFSLKAAPEGSDMLCRYYIV
ncbi:MAG: ABC transporter ATP-binding protein [Oscillospiraceae bacterium]